MSADGTTAADSPGVVELTRRLIRFDTTNPPGDEAACVRHVAGLLAAAGVETRLLGREPNRPNLVARIPGRGEAPPLLLHAHVDVVPTRGQPWTRDPFAGELVDGEVWGRGAVDMKGQLAMMLDALLTLRANGRAPAGDVLLAVVCDEEAGSAAGAKYLVREHPELFAGVRHAIGEDGGATLSLGGRTRFHPVVVAEKRACWVRAVLRGTAGHASRVTDGSGAAHKLTRLLGAIADGGLGVLLTPPVDLMLKELEAALPAEEAARLGAFRADPSDASPLAGFDDADIRYLRSVVRHTVNATVIHGGTKTNVLPAEITVELDGRLLPGPFDTPGFLAELRARAGVEMDLEVFVEGEQMPEPRLGDFYSRLTGVLRRHDPDGVPVPMVTTASTDARLFPGLGIETYGWLPLLHGGTASYRDMLHVADERIAVEALEFGARCYLDLLLGHG
ncbi:M20/M25/M40 family metallo-hydrolase [Streptomyces sp. NPDC052077]|uniref:M20/M25/M40 family metallo-hydrolase n=1 Tax=Streptomyces sp. NPDC052077 TaxID=3154757 RepID=UPI0034157675